MAALRVLIADDNPLFGKTLEALLAGEPEVEVIGIAGNGLEALRLAATLRPDVVLMDIDMPELDGLAATTRLTALRLATRVIILTASDDPGHSARALEAGAAAYLTKDRVATTLVPTVRRVAGTHGSLTADGGADVAGRARVG